MGNLSKLEEELDAYLQKVGSRMLEYEETQNENKETQKEIKGMLHVRQLLIGKRVAVEPTFRLEHGLDNYYPDLQEHKELKPGQYA